MLLTLILCLAVVTGALAVLSVVLILCLWVLLTGRVTVEQSETQPAMGWQAVPSVLHRKAKA